MPTYQYACTESACGHRFEAVQSFSDDPLTSCPVCEGRLRKVFSAVGVVFKGSGFYRTDSREAPKTSPGSETKETQNGTSAEKGSETAPASSTSSSSSSSGSGSSGSGSSGAGSPSGPGSSGSGSSGSSSPSTSRAAAG